MVDPDASDIARQQYLGVAEHLLELLDCGGDPGSAADGLAARLFFWTGAAEATLARVPDDDPYRPSLMLAHGFLDEWIDAALHGLRTVGPWTWDEANVLLRLLAAHLRASLPMTELTTLWEAAEQRLRFGRGSAEARAEPSPGGR